MLLADLRRDLQKIVSNNNIEGTIANAIVDLLVVSIYNNQITSSNVVQESNLLTASSLNSVITHAQSRGYSVYRGQLPKYRVKDISPIVTKDGPIKRFDLFIRVGEYDLLFDKDYPAGFPVSVPIIELDLVLVPKNSKVTKTVVSDSYLKLVEDSDISEDLIVIDSDTNTKYNIVKNFENYSILSDQNQIIVQTSTDFGVSLIKPNRSVVNTYVVTYLKYSDILTLPTQQDIESKIVKEYTKGSEFNIDSFPAIPRETNLDSIKFNCLRSYRSRETVSSNEDLIYLFKEFFKSDPEVSLIGVNVIVTTTSIDFFYKLDDLGTIPDAKLDAFKSDLESFYIKDTTINIQVASGVSYTLDLGIYFTSSPPNSDVLEIIKRFEDNLELTEFKLFELISELSKLDSVVSIDPKTSSNSPVALSPAQYIDITSNEEYILWKSN